MVSFFAGRWKLLSARFHFSKTHRLLLGLALVLSGCQESLQVRVYEMPKEAKTALPQREQSSVSQPRRIVGAVIPQGEQVLFLKGTDTPQRLEGTVPAVVELCRGLVWDGAGIPQWKLPEGWIELPGSGMAMAILEGPSADGSATPVRWTVTLLGRSGQWENYLQENLNRWRGQLNLSPVDLKTWRDEWTEVSREGSDQPVVIVDLTGTGSGGMAGSGVRGPLGTGASSGKGSPAPAATGSSSNTTPPSSASQEADEAQGQKIRYQTPEGWESLGEGPFRLAAFRIPDGSASQGGACELTVSLARNDPRQNAQMWVGQVAPKASEEEKQKQLDQALAEAKTFQRGPHRGTIYWMAAGQQPEDSAIWVASIPYAEGTVDLFIKVRGSRQAIELRQEEVLHWIESLSWDPPKTE
jgi:hypothetical protein